MTNETLQKLVDNKTIASYSFCNVDCYGNIGEESDFRNTEMLILIFPNGERLVISTFCSGSSENTSLHFES